MPFALALITVGAWFLYSGLKGQSLVDVLAGKGTESKLDPAGGKVSAATSSDGSSASDATAIPGGGSIGSISGGAKGIVDAAADIAKQVAPKSQVVSGYRPGSTTSSGNRSDHASNSSTQAARDIGYQGVNALTGPWPPELTTALKAIGQAFGRNYGSGRTVDTFNWKGYRIQIIAETPEYGGHMGHIHIGARKQ